MAMTLLESALQGVCIRPGLCPCAHPCIAAGGRDNANRIEWRADSGISFEEVTELFRTMSNRERHKQTGVPVGA